MSLLSKNHIDAGKADEYAAREDFCKLFTEDMTGLYLLSLVLTANHETAEQCFVAGLEDCVNGALAFKEWAHSWAKRRIIQCAIRAIAPGAQHTNDASKLWNHSEEKPWLAAILELDTFERFAFVMSVLEGYSDQECSILLGCSREEIANARSQALKDLSKLHADHARLFKDASFHPATNTQTF